MRIYCIVDAGWWNSAKREAECSVWGGFPHTCICLRWRSCVGHSRMNLKTTNWTKDTTPKSCHYLMLLLLCDSFFPLDNNNVRGVSVSSFVFAPLGAQSCARQHKIWVMNRGSSLVYKISHLNKISRSNTLNKAPRQPCAGLMSLGTQEQKRM